MISRLTDLLLSPLRALARRHALRRQADLTTLAVHLGRIGRHREAAMFTATATEWGRIANGTRRKGTR